VKRTGVIALAASLAACTQPAAPPPAASAAPAAPPAGMQWLYGSGEAAATSIQTYRALRDFVLAAAKERSRDSVILSAAATLERPDFVPCGRKPLAVVLDVDETVLQNLGYEYDEAVKGRSFDSGIWQRWERTGADKVAPIPGALTALRAIRAAGLTVVFNSNREATNAAQTEAALVGQGLGPAKHRETLWLSGDVGTGSAKDGRRAAIAERYCVVAMAGDQLGDFSDQFNAKSLAVRARREAVTSGAYARLWGDGWFMFANPVYGPSIRGSFDDVFPADTRWTDPGEE
jgi:5'-nucleotidase (lipoprotein e(P4) family)